MPSSNNRVVCALLLGLLVQHALFAQETAHETTELVAMRTAARAWCDSLDAGLRQKGIFPFDADLRQDWHFIPKERQGVAWLDMNLDGRRAAHQLLHSALSNQGYLKAITIMSLENELRRLESDRPDVESIRHPEKYWFAVFGDPSSDKPWGWRVEGHHLSLNFTSTGTEVISITPAFFGSNPAELREGPRAGLRVMGEEEDSAREIIHSCTDEQLQDAMLSDAAPEDVLTVPGAEIKFAEPDGLSATEMSADQLNRLLQLVELIAGNFHQELAEHALEEIRTAGTEKLHFGWAGSTKRGEGHYFRIHGPSMVIEYDNTQNNANHCHLVWHSTANDFGADFLQRHYRESPHHQGQQ